MLSFMEDFNIFFSFIISALTSLWTWLISTILGKIIIFIFVISIFMWIVDRLVSIGD